MAGIALLAIKDRKLNQCPQIFESMPRVQFAHVVVANEVEKLRPRMPRMHRFDSVDRVAWPFAMQLAFVEFEPGLAFDRSRQQFAPEACRSRSGPEFVRGNGGGDENHTIESQQFNRVPRKDQMSMMDRIESAPVEGDSARRV